MEQPTLNQLFDLLSVLDNKLNKIINLNSTAVIKAEGDRTCYTLNETISKLGFKSERPIQRLLAEGKLQLIDGTKRKKGARLRFTAQSVNNLAINK